MFVSTLRPSDGSTSLYSNPFAVFQLWYAHTYLIADCKYNVFLRESKIFIK